MNPSNTRCVRALLALACALSLSGCAAAPSHPAEDKLQVLAATYPLYALAAAVSAGAEDMELSRLNTGQVSCLHDYTLTVSDARRLEQADLLLLNGAGLERFLDSALENLDAPAVDCSAHISLLEADGEEHHDHPDRDDQEDHDYDPHYWMDPRNAAIAAEEIAAGLSVVDPDQAELYRRNAEQVAASLRDAYASWAKELEALSCPYLITFHNGFRYFARAFGLELLFAMEEEEGATASAKDIRAAADFVKAYGLQAVFMERNGSGCAARAVAGETGAAVRALSMLMDGPELTAGMGAAETVTALYLQPMEQNINTLLEVFS